MTSLTIVNDASHAVKHGSVWRSAIELHPPLRGWCRESNPNHLLVIIALSLLFASAIPCQGQEHAGILDGDGVIAEIRETRRELREHREAIVASAAESAAWRKLIDRDEEPRLIERIGNRFSGFLDRIGLWGAVLCGTVVAVAGLIGLPLGLVGGAILVREMRRQVA